MEPVLRVFQAPHKSYFLFGARATGKSTWLRIKYPQATVIDLLDSEQYWTYQTSPNHLQEVVLLHEAEHVFVIDEVQKVPQLLSVVHLSI